jgi:hypothetical protein
MQITNQRHQEGTGAEDPEKGKLTEVNFTTAHERYFGVINVISLPNLIIIPLCSPFSPTVLFLLIFTIFGEIFVDA